MTMTRQHFALIAEVIEQSPFAPGHKEYLAETFAEKLRATNPNFNRARFLRACGAED